MVRSVRGLQSGRDYAQRSLADKLRSQQEQSSIPPHLLIEARAGTGKTTTLIEGLKILKGEGSRLTPSPQQKLIWDSLALSQGADTIAFVAFNKAIAEELQRRVPRGVQAMTMHSMGGKAVRAAFPGVICDEDRNPRVPAIIEKILNRDIWDIRRKNPILLQATEKLVAMVKMNLAETDPDSLATLAGFYDIDAEEEWSAVVDLVPQVIEACKNVAKDRRMDFNDMVWLPVALNLPVTKYDLLLVDEAQDLNRVQQALARKAGRRQVYCGDPKQAIYGFAGADSQSMRRLAIELAKDETVQSPGCTLLPLTVTRRCGKAIVREANKLVADFEAFETNGEGRILEKRLDSVDPPNTVRQDSTNYRSWATDGDMVLCRVTAPLVSECFKFIKDGRKAIIRGRDIAQGLVSTINKLMKSYVPTLHIQRESVLFLMEKIGAWLEKEIEKEMVKKNPSTNRMISLQDRHDCIMTFAEDADHVNEILARIDQIFNDKTKEGVVFSSIHKAKGLEARRVFILLPEGASIPHPMAKTEWQVEQEYNLLYVAITRAIEELVYVRGGKAVPREIGKNDGRIVKGDKPKKSPTKKAKK